MAKKIIPLISIVVITVLGLFFIFDSGSNHDILKSTFEINAIYYDEGYVEISYLDKTAKTNHVVLEILGMDKSFQKTLSGSQFVEIVPFPILPKYGWQVHPVTFLIDHQDLGKVSLKTEIHSLGEPAPPIIYGSP
ncbi:MAG: hypothetical protein COY74_00950 [Nitrosopumilales archaeon CG_4_10_14_0_8_um_filter_34_8]|nr:MAG: hypothetical protein COY74_00950 [Nitrosopumilales archaeon CG_4_10_14_0_8_um_filter_34_8]